MDEIFKIDNTTTLNEALNQGKPKHPLISVADFSKVDFVERSNMKAVSEFYCIMVKNLVSGSLKYGRNYYDFQDGTLFFLSPNQVIAIEDPKQCDEVWGWGLFFHPDLIRGTSLSKKMKDYTFFHYDVNEALHLSDHEKEMLTNIVGNISLELDRGIDKHSQSVIVSTIELLLNYCMRFYDRQFITRTNANKDVISKFENFLSDYFNSNRSQEEGMPTVKICAEAMNLSANYLTDLLKKETGKNTQEHIHYHVIEAAKEKLLSSSVSVSEIAYSLGFEYPQYFSKIFKKKTGVTPAGYRSLN